jgi:hypothetical protein
VAPTPITTGIDARAKKSGKKLDSKIRADKAKKATKAGGSR